MAVSRAVHLRSGDVFADRTRVAVSFGQRLRGLIGQGSLGEGEGLYIPRCSSIHTFFMRFPIDVVFLDGENRVLRTIQGMRPFRVALGPGKTKNVLEMRSGTMARKDCRSGDVIEIEY